jgi:DNA-binding transcriptional LysR family regulator
MAQPPLSQQIQQLERELGVRLFKRTNRRVELTYAGQVFLGEVRTALEQVETATRAVKRADGRDFGSLTIGAGVVPIHTVLSRVLPDFRKQFPGVDFRLRELLPHEQARMLRQHSIDVSFVIPPFEHVGLDSQVILQENIIAVLPNDHALARKRVLDLDELATERFVMPNRSWAPTFYDQLINACREAGFSPNIVHTAGEFQTIFTLVGAGLGVALATVSTRTSPVDGVACVPTRSTPVPVCMAWRSDEPNPAVRSFLDMVRSSTGSNGAAH